MEVKKLIVDEVKNSGLVMENPDKKDYHSKLFKDSDAIMIGAVSPLEDAPVIFPDSKGWEKVAKSYGFPERQFNRNFDTYSCVVFAIAKAICYYLYKRYGIKTTISEMYNAFYAGVVPEQGTSIRKGMESFRKYGRVSDRDYPFTKKTTSREYYSKPPSTIKIMAEGKLTEWNFHWEVVPPYLKNINKQYKRTPVVLTGFAWAAYYGSGVYYDNNAPANHAFLGLELLDNGNNLCDDTYPKNGDKYREILTKEDMFKELSKSYDYGSAHACWLTPTNKTKKTLLNYIISMFKKISRDIHGGFWFITEKDGKKYKQKITDWVSMLGSIIAEIGVEKNNLTDKELEAIPDFRFFGK